MAFDGFGDDVSTFYEGLAADNSRTYWDANRSTYDASVREPMLALLADLAPEFGDGTMFRPYRDVRFSKDKSPYKTTAAGMVRRQGGSSYYVQVSIDGLLVGGGLHRFDTSQLRTYRAAVNDDVVGDLLLRIVAELTADGHEVGGETLRTAPRGWAPDHPRIDLLRHKELIAYRAWPASADEPWFTTRDCLDAVAAAWRAYAPLDDWIDRHVGPAAPMERGRR